MALRVAVRAYPGAPQTSVGGRYGIGEPPVLIVRVRPPAVDGKANEAVLRALAEAFGLRRSDVTLASGASGRLKIVALEGADPETLARLLRGAGS
jgi:hypothetical protein